MEVVEYVSKNLLRQATEAMLIGKHSKDYKVINRRGEWGQNLPPKLKPEEVSKAPEHPNSQSPNNFRGTAEQLITASKPEEKENCISDAQIPIQVESQNY